MTGDRRMAFAVLVKDYYIYWEAAVVAAGAGAKEVCSAAVDMAG